MEVMAVVGTALASLPIVVLARYYLAWRLAKLASENRQRVSISGIIPSAVQVEFDGRCNYSGCEHSRDEEAKRERIAWPIQKKQNTFVPEDYPARDKFARLTRQEERAGLLDGSSTIGTALGWQIRLGELGYRVNGHRLMRSGTPSQ